MTHTQQSDDVLLSIVIIHIGQAKLLENCLESIAKTTRTTSYEVIVVDNESGLPAIPDFLEKYSIVRTASTPGRVGYSKASNIGVRESKGKYIMWCNDDLVFRDGSIDGLVQFLEVHADYGAASPRLLNSDGSFQACFSLRNIGPISLLVERLSIGWLLPSLDMGRHWKGFEKESRDVAVSAGACSVIRKNALAMVGGFDERFFLYCEEFDVCKRLAKAGWRIRYISELDVVHLGSQTTVNSPNARAFRWVIQSWKSKFAYLRKHYGRTIEICYAVIFAITAVPRMSAYRLAAMNAKRVGNLEGYQDSLAKLRLHTFSLHLALSAKRADASQLPQNWI